MLMMLTHATVYSQELDVYRVVEGIPYKEFVISFFGILAILSWSSLSISVSNFLLQFHFFEIKIFKLWPIIRRSFLELSIQTGLWVERMPVDHLIDSVDYVAT